MTVIPAPLESQQRRLSFDMASALAYSSVFGFIFLTRIHGYFDVGALILFLYSAFWFTRNPVVPREIIFIGSVLLFFGFYASALSLVYGVQELIWPLKFARTFLVFSLGYFFFLTISQRWSYAMFCRIVIWMVLAHSLIIYSAILSSEFRSLLYGFTGYEPRGPSWERSPGLTVSFNATAIVHMTGLFFLIRDRQMGFLTKALLGILIAPSLLFLGRFVSYLGFFFIGLYSFLKYPWAFLLTIAVLGVVATGFVRSELALSPDDATVVGRISANVLHAIGPIISLGDKGGVDSYFQENLADHVYLTDDWRVLLFGNSRSGHIGLIDELSGQTGSDIGLVNSINANGIIITVLIVMFYVYLVASCRRRDFQSAAFIASLSIANAFKETGFFESHSTPLLMLTVYYQMFGHGAKLERSP
jgi:hypothetical protein